MEIEATFVCAYCLQINNVVVDSTGGREQAYIEDCQVCCRPNKLSVSIDEDRAGAEIYAEIA